MKKLTVCTNCFEINSNENRKCGFCGTVNYFHENIDLLEEATSGYFFAYQSRLSIEDFVEKHGSQFRPQFSHLGPNEIFGFVFLAVVSGVTWDVIKVLLIKIKDSALKQGIRIENEFSESNYPSIDEETINKLLSDDAEIELLTKYILEYQSEYQDVDVHNFVVEEAVFLQAEIIESNRSTLSKIRDNLNNMSGKGIHPAKILNKTLRRTN